MTFGLCGVSLNEVVSRKRTPAAVRLSRFPTELQAPPEMLVLPPSPFWTSRLRLTANGSVDEQERPPLRSPRGRDRLSATVLNTNLPVALTIVTLPLSVPSLPPVPLRSTMLL